MKKKKIPGMFDVTRREALGLMGGTAAALCVGCAPNGGGGGKPGRKLLILGFDGMDYNLVAEMLGRGELPNFARVAKGGTYLPLVSSTPPQSPVAWSNFITGKNPGGHGIFDFIARDPETYLPQFSLSKVSGSEETVSIAGRTIPIKSGKVELLRKGEAWWKILEEKGIPATVLNVPSNFPPVETTQKSISGMGTPDILGTYGTFSFYTSEPVDDAKVQGGKIYHVDPVDGVVRAEILGPKNALLKDNPDIMVPFEVYIDEKGRQAKLTLQGHEVILKEGEWSGWLNLKFTMSAPFDIKGMVRVYLKGVGPVFKLYISPVQIDPEAPSVPISTPAGYSADVARELGEFYTQGIPEDTWALNEGRLDEDEFLVQAALVKAERTAVFKMELERFREAGEGVYFCYFGLTDTGSHMFWCHRDPKHPMYDPKLSPKYAGAVEGFYRQMDEVVGHALGRLPEDTGVMIMSDHGFSPFYRAFHVNRWLHDNGYLVFLDETKGESNEFLENVDWTKTKAYALGLNSLYVNLAGREGQGVVSKDERPGLVAEIISKISAFKDPGRGETVVSSAYDTTKIYNGAYTALAPDIILGYAGGYRGSWETALGKVPKEPVRDNMKKWSGDHCMDPAFVPGIFFFNRKVSRNSLYIQDIAPSILAFFGITPPGDMDGKTFI